MKIEGSMFILFVVLTVINFAAFLNLFIRWFVMAYWNLRLLYEVHRRDPRISMFFTLGTYEKVRQHMLLVGPFKNEKIEQIRQRLIDVRTEKNIQASICVLAIAVVAITLFALAVTKQTALFLIVIPAAGFFILFSVVVHSVFRKIRSVYDLSRLGR